MQSVPAPAPAQSEYIIIPPPAPTGGARTRPQPWVQPPPPSHPPPPTNPPPSSSGFDDLSDVFSGSGALTSLYRNQPQAPPTFAPPPQQNPFGMSGQPPPPSYPPPPVQEPSITMDLMDAIRNPQSGPTTAYPIGMGMRMPGLGMGTPGGYETGQFQFGGSMEGFPSGPQPPQSLSIIYNNTCIIMCPYCLSQFICSSFILSLPPLSLYLHSYLSFLLSISSLLHSIPFILSFLYVYLSLPLFLL